MNETRFVYPFILKHPFTCPFAGPTQSGKTWLLKKVLVYNINLFDISPKTITYYYSPWQKSFDKFDEISPTAKFHKEISKGL